MPIISDPNSGGCSYRYVNNASSSASVWCTWAQVSSFQTDSPGCGSSSTCTCGTFQPFYLCGTANSTPFRSLNSNGSYYIFVKYMSYECPYGRVNGSCIGNSYNLSHNPYIERRNHAGTLLGTLNLTCQLFNANTNGWTTSYGVSNMSVATCYFLQFRCTHPYLNNSIFGTSRTSFWTQDCQPCVTS